MYRQIESWISATDTPGPNQRASSGSSDLLISSRSIVLVASAKIYCVSLSNVLNPHISNMLSIATFTNLT